MRKPQTVAALDKRGAVRLSPNFIMREFLHGEVAAMHGFSNAPDDPDLVVEAGRRLCGELLEPLHAAFGKVIVRSPTARRR